MKNIYIDIMERALGAYTDARIDEYIARVKREGITEHGFPRLTANIGILIAHGRRCDLKERFLDMMDFCCETLPYRKAANDFSIRELVFALLEWERMGYDCTKWRRDLAAVDPFKCYSCIAKKPTDSVGNWAMFGCTSEYLREFAGIGNASAFLELHMPTQLQEFDESGLYRDPNCPMVYDLAVRVLLSVMLHYGYRGRFRDEADEYLKRGGLLTLKLQSSCGEIPFGGRSNQFLLNEAMLAAVCEAEANRYHRMGDKELAGQFKDAAALAADNIMGWLDHCRGQKHVKNRYPQDSGFGCEGYGYFDKYMITLASNIYCAYVMADDSILPLDCPAKVGGFTLKTSDNFHKFVANCGGYMLEFDLNADLKYDANGLGRIHRNGAKPTVALSVPFPKTPANYVTAGENVHPLAMCAGSVTADGIVYACCEPQILDVKVTREDSELVAFELICTAGGRKLTEAYEVSADGVKITVSGEGEIAYAIPIFRFDGKVEAEVKKAENRIVLFYEGSSYAVEADCSLIADGVDFYNRNGAYTLYHAQGHDKICLKLTIE